MNDNLGSHLKKLRLSCNYSLRKAAQLSGLSHGYIRDVELGGKRTNGIIVPMPQTLRKFAEAYDTSFDELMLLAGHLDSEIEFKPSYTFIEIDLHTVLFVEVDNENKINYHLANETLSEEKSLHDYTLLEEKLEQHNFIRVHSGTFANLKHIRFFDEDNGRIYFSADGQGKYISITWMTASKYKNILKRAVARNNNNGMNISEPEPSVFTLIRSIPH